MPLPVVTRAPGSRRATEGGVGLWAGWRPYLSRATHPHFQICHARAITAMSRLPLLEKLSG